MKLIHALIAAMVVTLAPYAHAGDRAVAEALFAEARALMDQGKYAEACPKLDASNKADPAVGTQLNLANCYEKIGKTASAWSMYLQVLASPGIDASRAALARSRSDALAPTLSKLTIRVPHPIPNLRVTRDSVLVDAATFGVPIPIDPGHHVVDATVDGLTRFHAVSEVTGSAGSVVVTIQL